MANGQFDIPLIPEFNGAAIDLPVVEWFEDVELVSELSDIQEVEHVIPLWLRGGVLAVYRQFRKKQRFNVVQVKQVLETTFTIYSFVAFESFMTQRLLRGKTVDVFLAEL